MPICNLIEYTVIIIQEHQEVYGNTIEMNPALVNSNIVDFSSVNCDSALYNFKEKITGKTGADSTKDAEIIRH